MFVQSLNQESFSSSCRSIPIAAEGREKVRMYASRCCRGPSVQHCSSSLLASTQPRFSGHWPPVTLLYESNVPKMPKNGSSGGDYAPDEYDSVRDLSVHKHRHISTHACIHKS